MTAIAQPRPEDDLEALSALDAAWLQGWIGRRGPWVYHVTHRRNRESIERTGLVPWDWAASGSRFTTVATPRSGHVYFVTEPDDCAHQWELSGVDPAEGLVVCADLRRIAPGRIKPDEDPWTLGVLDHSELGRWGLGLPAEALGEGKRWSTGGDWAACVNLGAQRGIVEWALDTWGRIAVAGAIAPSALKAAPCDSAGRWVQPE